METTSVPSVSWTETMARFEQKLRERGLASTPRERITRRNRHEPVPLSPAQRGLWLIDRFNPGDPTYNVGRTIVIEGPFSVEVFARSVRHVAERHDVLRSACVATDGGPVQMLQPACELRVPVVDLADWPDTRVMAEAERQVIACYRAPFGLERAPLWHAMVVRLPRARHLIVFTAHHIICDAWSLDVLIRDLTQTYQALLAGRPVALPALPIQYADWVLWHRQALASPESARQLDRWRQRLRDPRPTMDVGGPDARPSGSSGTSGGSVGFRLNASRRARVLALSASASTTPFVTLLAAFAVLLRKYTGLDDLLIGTPVTNRRELETEHLIGFFLNTVVLRLGVTGADRFDAIVRRCHAMVAESLADEDLPFERLVEELKPARHGSRNPLVRVLFAYQATSRLAHETPRGAGWGSLGFATGTARFDLTLALVDTGTDLAGTIEYRRDVMGLRDAERLAEHYRTLLDRVLACPDIPIGDIAMLTDAERHEAVVAINQTRATLAALPSLHTVVESQARRTPDAVAVRGEALALTYRHLMHASAALAAKLRAEGVRPDALVGLCMERAPELLVALLGVLRAGAAWVPFDPEYPAARLASMIEDSGISVLLTQQHLEPLATRICVDTGSRAHSSSVPTRVVIVEAPASGHDAAEEPPSPRALGDQLAYVIYTSGSTGMPKGTMNTHAAIVNRLLWMQQAYPLTADDRVLQKTPYTFDVSLWEFFWPLLTGAELVVLPPGLHRDANALVRTIRDERITAIHFVPSMLSAFLDHPEVTTCTSLRRIFASGEALPFELQERCLAQLPWVELHNLYGPTEAAVDVTAWPCDHLRGDRRVPIGRPISNVETYVLDRDYMPVLPGRPGELFLGGAGLGRGYWRRPDLTAAHFVPHPFADEPGRRLYATGDRVRLLEDGNLEYLGRLDQQIKLRGHRIELGDIERTLCAEAGVTAAAVVHTQQADPRLVAFVVPATGATLDLDALRAGLRASLPEHMVPASIASVPSLPLSAHGKVDRRALVEAVPPPAPNDATDHPRTAIEDALVAMWMELLGMDRIGVRSNFFELGGHSLLATRILSRVQTQFGVEIGLPRLFDQPTIAALAEAIEEALRDARGVAPLPPLVPVPRQPELPVSFAQQRLWLVEQSSQTPGAYNVPLGARLHGSLDLAALQAALTDLELRHEPLRTCFLVRDSELRQRIEAAATVPIATVDLSGFRADGREAVVRALADEEARRRFDLAFARPWRVLLLHLAAAEHVLLVTLHHIVSDGWSLDILLDELTTLYEARRQGRTAALAPLRVQYADFASWQRQVFEGPALARELTHWREQLAAAEPLQLPERRTSAPATAQAAHREVTLDAALRRALAETSRREGATFYMTLLAAFAAVLHRYTGQRDLVIGTPIANRTRQELEPLIGVFVNTLAVRVRLDPAGTFRDLLRHVRAVSLDAYVHQDLPFDFVIDELRAEGHTSPIVLRATFAAQEARAPKIGSSDLRVGRFHGRTGTVKFPLNINVTIGSDGLRLSADYDARRLTDAVIDGLLSTYAAYLNQIAADTDIRLDALRLPVEESARITRYATAPHVGTRRPFVPDAIDENVARTPEAPAIGDDAETLNYGALGRRANAIAESLLAYGSGRESIVALWLDRHVTAFAVMLAAWKCGAAYLPFDVHTPAERIRAMLDQAGARVLVTTPALVATLGPVAIPVVDVESLRRSAPALPPLAPRLHEDELAYVMFTSGSSGAPKAVAISHGGLANMVAWVQRAYDVVVSDRATQLASLAFDAIAFEVWPYLAAGASVHITPGEARLSASRLLRWHTERGITVSFVPTALVPELLSLPLSPRSRVRLVYTGGDRLPRLPRATLPFRLVNNYGPTEATVTATAAELTSADASTDEAPSIGGPIDGTGVHVLNTQGALVPIGGVGELYISGLGLARGYLHRPDLTAERFVPDHITGGSGAHMYRTGDLVRWRDDGMLEFLGRIDAQVQIAGRRVEPAEIEAVLCRHPDVCESLVALRARPDGTPLLVALVKARAGASLQAPDLRRFAASLLPAYMRPARYLIVEALPRTTTGKIDRQASIDWSWVGASSPVRSPAVTPTEQRLAAIWRDALHLTDIDVDESFFDLGGHSLLLVHVQERLQQESGRTIPILTLFEHPTIRALAAVLDAASTGPAAAGTGTSTSTIATSEETPDATFADRIATGRARRTRRRDRLSRER